MGLGQSREKDARSVVLLDVDHTLLFGNMGGSYADMGINTALLTALLQRGHMDVYLFTDMTFSMPSVEERQALVHLLKERFGFRVHGVITPCDVAWQSFPSLEALQLHQMCSTDGLYKGKFHGAEFEAFLFGQSAIIPGLATAVGTYSPETNSPGAGFAEVLQEIVLHKQLSVESSCKSMFAKAIADHLSEKHGYAHTKGLMLDLFLHHAPPWVNSIVVCDDNRHVDECMRRFRRVNQTSAMLPLKMILVKGRDVDVQTYLDLLAS